MTAITLYAIGNGNYDSVDRWNTAANGSGTSYTNPQNGVDSFTLHLNGAIITMNVNVSVTQLLVTTATGGGYLNVSVSGALTLSKPDDGWYSNTSNYSLLLGWSVTLTINGDITYAGSGVCVAPAVNRTIIINGKATNVSSGYLISSTSNAVVTVTNSGKTVVNNTGMGRAIAHGSTGALTIIGNTVSSGGSGWAINNNGNCTCTITGDVTVSAAAYGVVIAAGTVTLTGNYSATANGAYCIRSTGGTTVLNGELSGVAGSTTLDLAGGTFSWTGNRTLSAGNHATFLLRGATLNLATASDSLSLTVSGSLVLVKTSGTLNLVNGSYSAALVRQVATGYIAVQGVDASAYIFGPTLPPAADVKSGASYGYAGDPQTGTLVGGSGEHAYVFAA